MKRSSLSEKHHPSYEGLEPPESQSEYDRLCSSSAESEAGTYRPRLPVHLESFGFLGSGKPATKGWDLEELPIYSLRHGLGLTIHRATLGLLQHAVGAGRNSGPDCQTVLLRSTGTNRFVHVTEKDQLRMGRVTAEQKRTVCPFNLLQRSPSRYTLQSVANDCYMGVSSCSQHLVELMNPPVPDQPPHAADPYMFRFHPDESRPYQRRLQSVACPDLYVAYGDSDQSEISLARDGSLFEVYPFRETTAVSNEGLDVVDGLSNIFRSTVVAELR